jgi:hypothetical protein
MIENKAWFKADLDHVGKLQAESGMKPMFKQPGDGLEPESVMQHRVEGVLKTDPKLEMECEAKSEKDGRIKTSRTFGMNPGAEHEAHAHD